VNLGEGFLHRSNPEQYFPDEGERREMAEIFLELARMRKRGEPLWEFSGFYEKAADYVLGRPVGPCDAAGLYIDLHADGGFSVCVDQPVIADLRNRSIAEIWPQLAAQQEAVARCAAATPCFYTCTYNISITAGNIAAFLRETARNRLRHSAGTARKGSPAGAG
jgi:hypothetical protein